MYYSTIGIVASFILVIVNADILFDSKNIYYKPAWQMYRKFLYGILVYYISDILWGLLESWKLSVLLYADTTVYFAVMAVCLALWVGFTVEYFGDTTLLGRMLVALGKLVASVAIVLDIINVFKPVLFTIEEGAVYKALPLRNVLLVIYIILFAMTSLYAVLQLIRSRNSGRKRVPYWILAGIGLLSVVIVLIQFGFPLLPIYAMGMMLGTSLLHTFVVIYEKENYVYGLEENRRVTELKDRFASLLNNIPGMAFTKDAKTGVYLTCNQAFVEYARKKTPEEVVGLTDAQIFDAETSDHFVQTDRMALSLTKPYIYFEDVNDGAGGRKQLQTTKLKYTDTAGRLCVLGMCQDVTNLVRIQHEHAMTKEAYDKAVSAGLMYTNIAQTLAKDYIDLYYVNTDTEEYIEYRTTAENSTLSEVRRGWHFFSDCRKELAESVFEDDREVFLQALGRKTLMKALSRKNSFSMTYRQMNEGVQVYVNMKISRMEDDHYIIMGISDVDAEMRETKAKNEALAEALASAEAANKAKTSFLSGMSHELRTPINAIIGLDTLALKNEKLGDDTKKYLEKIGESAGHLLSIINDILDMSRIESGRVQLHKAEFNLGTMLDRLGTMVTSQCREKGLKFECRVQEHVDARYLGDEMKLKEMLLNILSNAVKFTEAPGSVTLTVEKTAEHDNQSTLCFKIKDTGIGIDKDYLPKIFDEFSRESSGKTNKYGSSGLGLAITKKVVELMNGTIDVESEKGVGTEFTVTIPLRNCEHSEAEQLLEINPEAMYVLVVDNDPIEAEHARMVLEEVGIRADAVTSGQEALRRLEIQRAKFDHYNFILMDWNMPGMNGMETSAEIRKLYGDEYTVIALTAYNWDDIHNEAQAAGVEYFIAKPLFASNILTNFENIARKSNLTVFKEKTKANLSGRRILLAEDVELNAEIMTDSLEIENIKVDHAQNGEIAVEMFEKSTAGIYAAILMDVRMPVMDGLEAARTIRAMHRADAKTIPIIALTANAFDEDVQLSMQAGMNAHLSKPVETEQLIRVLGELVYEAER